MAEERQLLSGTLIPSCAPVCKQSLEKRSYSVLQSLSHAYWSLLTLLRSKGSRKYCWWRGRNFLTLRLWVPPSHGLYAWHLDHINDLCLEFQRRGFPSRLPIVIHICEAECRCCRPGCGDSCPAVYVQRGRDVLLASAKAAY